MCIPNPTAQAGSSLSVAPPVPAAPPTVAPTAADPMDYSNKYNTKLSPGDEKRFQAWALKNNRLGDAYDYDIRGAWKELESGKMKQADNGHLGDKYKKPNHPTFSNESIYHGVDGNVGGAWGKDKNGKYTFTPSANHKWGQAELQDYFNKYEKGNYLLPRR